MPKRAILLVLIVVASVAGGLWWWQQPTTKQEPERNARQPPVLVTGAMVSLRDLPIYLDTIGTVQANKTVTVKSRVDGQIMEIRFREGQDVKSGDILAIIDPRLHKAQLDQAAAKLAQDRAMLDNARIDLDRYRELSQQKYASRQQYDTQRAQVAQMEALLMADQAAVDNATTYLGYTTIRAPIDGRTGIRLIDEGNIVRAGDPTGIVTIVQLQPISVLFSLPQQRLGRISSRMAAEPMNVVANTPDGGTDLDRGVVTLVDNQIDPATGTIRLKATFPNENLSLWPGGFVEVRLHLETRKDALIVPTPAVRYGPDGAFVYVIQDGARVRQRPVVVALSLDGDTEIASGLVMGEQVVAAGYDRLRDGARVTLAPATTNNQPPSRAKPATPPAQPPPIAAANDRRSGENSEAGRPAMPVAR